MRKAVYNFGLFIHSPNYLRLGETVHIYICYTSKINTLWFLFYSVLFHLVGKFTILYNSIYLCFICFHVSKVVVYKHKSLLPLRL